MDLNSFCLFFLCAGNNTSYQETAQSIYRSLKFRSQIIENKFGAGTSNPSVLGQMLIEYQTHDPEKKFDFLKEVRFLPSYVKFKVQLEAWAAAALKELEAEAAAGA